MPCAGPSPNRPTHMLHAALRRRRLPARLHNAAHHHPLLFRKANLPLGGCLAHEAVAPAHLPSPHPTPPPSPHITTLRADAASFRVAHVDLVQLLPLQAPSPMA